MNKQKPRNREYRTSPMSDRELSALRAKAGKDGYSPGPQMQMNLERSAKVYPHRLITPKSVGNGTERAHGFGRGA